ncbi:MAG TPA: lipoyl(octanoyl) transferase LipB [Solirubrobacterales bacterium]|nr:lipoyl(octanoyl) transferase LipB [Solirubrobacterales bacterium]
MAPLKENQIGVVRLGRRPYLEMSASQADLVEARRAGRLGDLLLVLEHPATYTKGRRTEPADLLRSPGHYAERGIEVCDTPRGGKVTYHGPGQLVIYPVIDLRGIGEQPEEVDRIDVAGFVSALERAMTAALTRWEVEAARIEGLTGLWVSRKDPIPDDATAVSMAPGVARGEVRKIGSIGLRISRGISSHGLSLNVSCDLSPFDDITSCGIEQCQVTSIALETGNAPSVDEVGQAVCDELAALLGRDPVPVSPAEIGLGTPVSATA